MTRIPALLLLCAIPFAAFASAPADSSDLVYAVIVTRHGVRSPLYRNETLAPYAADPWPQWEVAPGILTPHGREEMVVMGRYYRERFEAEKLLSGDAAADASRIFFRADNDERTRVTAEALAEGLAPGTAPKIRVLPAGVKDPLFGSVHVRIGKRDRALEKAAMMGEVGDRPERLVAEAAHGYDVLERILLPSGSAGSGRVEVRTLPPILPPARGAIVQGQILAEAILLEYADGKPMNEVGWGRLRQGDILPLTSLVSAGFFHLKTYYVAQYGGSNLAFHLLATLEQAARGQPVEGALGRPGDRLAILSGHDNNVLALARLLDVHWALPEAVHDLALPGGALVFELRRRRDGSGDFVRTEYVSQTYDQIRDNTPLTLDHPPVVAPVFVPTCSTAAPGYDAPLGRFEAHLRSAILPEFTTDEPAEVR